MRAFRRTVFSSLACAALLLLSGLVTPVRAEGAPGGGEYLRPEYLLDESRALTLEEVAKRTDWKLSPGPILRVGQTSARVWTRFKVPPYPEEFRKFGGVLEDPRYFLSVPSQILARVALYRVQDGRIESIGQSGLAVAMKDRSLRRSWNVFRFDGTNAAQEVYYLSAEGVYPIEVGLRLWDHGHFAEYTRVRMFGMGMFCGALVLVALFNLGWVITTRSKSQLYFSLFALSMALLASADDGQTIEFFWPDSPGWALIEMHVWGGLAVLFNSLFARTFLASSRNSPWLDRLLLGAVGVSTLRMVWVCFSMSAVISQIGVLSVIVSNFLIFFMAIAASRRRIRSAGYFLAASVVFNLGYFCYILYVINVLPDWPSFLFLPHAATIVEILLYSLAMGDRVRWAYHDLAEADRTLGEQRIAVMEAEKLSALGRMAGGIAHEINNPLLIIQGRAEQIERLVQTQGTDITELRRLAGTIRQTVFRISSIIHSMKKISRDSTHDPFEPVLVGAILQDTLALCVETFEQQGIRLRVNPMRDGLKVLCRSAEICQVLVNLLNNARDAVAQSPDKWVEIEVAGSDSQVRFSVTDSGPGIPPQIQGKILDPFFTTKPAGEGTGLGLSISRTLVENHRGKLWLDTEADHTRFIFTLPAGN